MEWIINHWAEILVIIGIAERFSKETKPDFKIFGIPIGKYDDQVVNVIKMIIRAIVPNGKKIPKKDPPS